MINTVLFDFDGTLVDTNDLILHSWQHTFRAMEGRERPVEQILATFGETLDYTMAHVFPGREREAAAIYRAYQTDRFADAITLFPGIRETLAALRGGGFKLGVVTSRLPRTTEIGLEKFGIDGFFDTVVTCADTEKSKPDPEPVLIALGRLGSRPEEALMIGDTMADVRSARNAGVRVALVAWGVAVTPADRNGPEAPDFIVNTAADILLISDAR